jgi:hypothetical protein
MDVSKRPSQEELGGSDLLKALSALSGLPQEVMETELTHIMETTGSHSTHLTLEQLRETLLCYLETLAIEEEKQEAQVLDGK